MKAMQWRCAVLAVLVVLSTGAAAFAQSVAPAAALAPAVALALDAAARDAVAVGDVPGAVVVVGQDGSVLYRRATGSRALVPAVEPMTIDTVFDVASLTKVVATMPAVLALWEEGRVDLDAPLGRYLKEFAGPGLSRGDHPPPVDACLRALRSAAPRGHGARLSRGRGAAGEGGARVRARIDLRL